MKDASDDDHTLDFRPDPSPGNTFATLSCRDHHCHRPDPHLRVVGPGDPPPTAEPATTARHPVEILQATASITSIPAPWIVASGVIVALVGIILVLVAVTGGRRARHVLNTVRSVTVVDDEVIASALARRAASTAGISPDNTEVTISRRRVDVRLTPISGVPVNQTAVVSAVAEELDSYQLEPLLRMPRVRMESRGKVGA